MAKEFKTIEELVALLDSRNVVTDQTTAGVLARESYYAIVNGYKNPFLDRDAMRSAANDVYRPGRNSRHVLTRARSSRTTLTDTGSCPFGCCPMT